VVLDEDLDVGLRHHVGPDVRAETVQYRGWTSLENGDLLRAMAQAGDVDVFITADRKMRYQQHVAGLPFALLVLRPVLTRLPFLLPLMPEVRRLLPDLAARPGTVTEVFPPGTAPGA
jgi:hypothetical protein